ncbi:BatA domain-containing protein [Formosa sp. S-31]|uniref:BatA domain-containing protein n=1 Tax=Formosa sp. S-31 TaxID=2790949 RepID=UPI003EC0D3FE
MQFKHPELLYALVLLVIPIIIHLFQLRKFKKEDFTNVAFLKKVVLQTRKSSQLKKWLTLLARILLLACIILAFAQPISSKTNVNSAPKETVIYLDNSFSLQQKGPQGPLLKRAVQDLISQADYETPISLVTNNQIFKNTTLKTIKNDLIALDYSPEPLDYNAALLKCKSLFSKDNNKQKEIIFISDFQQQPSPFSTDKEAYSGITLIPLKPANSNNIAIDSLYLKPVNTLNSELIVSLKNYGIPVDNLSIALYNSDKLMAKTAVSIKDEAKATFTINNKQSLNGKLVIEDSGLQFDNTMYFNLNTPSKINVLSITAADDSYLKRIFTEDEFKFSSSTLNQLNYNTIHQQHTIVLNELNDLPQTLINVLTTFINEGGNLIVIPSLKVDLSSYNQFLNQYNTRLNPAITSDKLITTINFSHPLYKNDVFEKQVKNFQYPKVNLFYPVYGTLATSALSFEDGNPFLSQINTNVYLFSAPINKDNSNFKNWALIVPTFYKIAVNSLKQPRLFYTVGTSNSFDVETTLGQDQILSISNASEHFISQQQYFNNKVTIKTSERPEHAGIYEVKNKDSVIKTISFNYNRSESKLIYDDVQNIKNVTIENSITSLFDNLKSDTKVNELWKWFLIFALAFLIIEMLILKYFK